MTELQNDRMTELQNDRQDKNNKPPPPIRSRGHKKARDPWTKSSPKQQFGTRNNLTSCKTVSISAS